MTQMHHPPYRKKTAPHRTRSQVKNLPKRTSHIKHSRSVANTRRKNRNSRSKVQSQPDSLIPSLNSLNLVRILNSFYTIRSTVKDLRVTLEKLDRAMDSAYQMFEIAQGFIGTERSRSGRRTPLRLLPSPNRTSNQPSERNGMPQTSPDNDEQADNNPLAGLLQNIDIEQIFTIMQSPIVQSILKQLAQGESSEAATNQRAKEG